MKLKKWTLTLCLMGTLLLPLQILTQTTLASEGQTEEELAPGFNDCISRSTSVLEMRQCNANAIGYWQDKLDKALNRAEAMCEQASQPEICKKRLDQSQAAWQDYVDMMADYRMEVSGGGSGGLLEQGHFRAEAIRAQARLLASGQTVNADTANASPQKGFEVQVLDSVEGLSPCKPGEDITMSMIPSCGPAGLSTVGQWLRLMHDGEPFAQTCVYQYWGVSSVQAGDLSFYQVESSQDGRKLLTLLSDQGMTLHVFHTSGPGLKERRVEDGKLVYFWEDGEGYTFKTVVGKNEIHTIPSSEECGDSHWTDLRLEELEYLGLDDKGLADIWYGHLFLTKDGQTLKLSGEHNSWPWLQSYQGKTLRIQWGKLVYGPGFGGNTLYAVMPGLAKSTEDGAAAPRYDNRRFEFSLSWLPENCTMQESDNGDGVTMRDETGFILLAYGTNSYLVMDQSMEDAMAELSSGLKVTYKHIDKEKSWFVVSGVADDEIVYIKCFFGYPAARILRMSYPKHKEQTYAPQVEKVVQGFRLYD